LWENYAVVVAALPVGRFFFNTALVAGIVVIGQVFTSAAAAYALARLRFPGRKYMVAVLLSIVLFPPVVLLVPRFVLIEALGWVDTYPGLVTTELVSVWGIFLLRQHFLTLPRDLEDAARLDGAGEWAIFSRLVLPLSKRVLTMFALLALVAQWKAFLWPLVVTRSLGMQVAEVGMASFHAIFAGQQPILMAAAVMTTAPLLVIFFVVQRYLVRDVPWTSMR
jgi:multiple sugar transport system permease protein